MFASENINSGTFIQLYQGERISAEEADLRVQQGNMYIMSLADDIRIDGSNQDNIARKINHSYTPNCVAETWDCHNEVKVLIRAVEDIQANEELSLNYGDGCYPTIDLECDVDLYERHMKSIKNRIRRMLHEYDIISAKVEIKTQDES